MPKLRLATAQYPIEQVASFEAWRDKQAKWVAAAADGGAELLVLPEYAPLELTATLPEKALRSLEGQLVALQPLLPRIHETHAKLARKHGVWLLAGSVLERVGKQYRNRARLFTPQGRVCVQDKLQLTRFEREAWSLSSGHNSMLWDTPFGPLGIAICYDVEFPLVVRRLVEGGARIVLVPSCTDTLAGYHRVSLSCRARALENQCFVVQAVTVGTAAWSLALDENRGAAGVFGPVDRGFPDDGVLAQGELDAPKWVFAELDTAKLTSVRRDGQVKNHEDWNREEHLHGRLVRAKPR